MTTLKNQISIPNILFAHARQFKDVGANNFKSQHCVTLQSGSSLDPLQHVGPDEIDSENIGLLNLEGDPETALSECIKRYDIDLVAVGLKDSASQFSKVGRRLLCITNADVLFIPSIKNREFSRILIPVDLSEKSYELVEKTRTQFPQAQIMIYFINYVPPKSVMNKTDREKLIETASKNLVESLSRFIIDLKCPSKHITFSYSMSDHFNAGYAIYEYASKTNFDLIVVGRLSTLDKELPFLGSVTEKILFLNNKLSVLVINH